MDIESIVTAGAYTGPLARSASYTDAGGQVRTLTVLRDASPETQLAGAELGVRGLAVAFRVRVSELATPCKGDRLVCDGVNYCVDAAPVRHNLVEWVLYVKA